jgi:hypothetical protein
MPGPPTRGANEPWAAHQLRRSAWAAVHGDAYQRWVDSTAARYAASQAEAERERRVRALRAYVEHQIRERGHSPFDPAIRAAMNEIDDLEAAAPNAQPQLGSAGAGTSAAGALAAQEPGRAADQPQQPMQPHIREQHEQLEYWNSMARQVQEQGKKLEALEADRARDRARASDEAAANAEAQALKLYKFTGKAFEQGSDGPQHAAFALNVRINASGLPFDTTTVGAPPGAYKQSAIRAYLGTVTQNIPLASWRNFLEERTAAATAAGEVLWVSLELWKEWFDRDYPNADLADASREYIDHHQQGDGPTGLTIVAHSAVITEALFHLASDRSLADKMASYTKGLNKRCKALFEARVSNNGAFTDLGELKTWLMTACSNGPERGTAASRGAVRAPNGGAGASGSGGVLDCKHCHGDHYANDCTS